jgi:ABC-2 type transport system permease protein
MRIRPKRIFAQTVKELTQLMRDHLTFTMALLLPLILLMLFGFTLSLEVNKINVAFQDLDLTPSSREYIATFERTNKFKVIAQGPEVNVSQLLDRGKIAAGLIIPPEFTRDLNRRKHKAQVQILIDGTDANTANIVRSYARATNNAFVENLRSVSNPTVVSVQSRMWYNPGLESLKYVGPGAVTISLALFPPLLAGLATAREREQGTIVQVYASSLTASEYLLGKATAYWLVGMVEVFLVNLAALPLFGLWFVGDPICLIVGSCLYVACGVFWGIFLGSSTNSIKSQSNVIQAVTFSAFLLSLLMSGFIYPVDNIPIAIRWITNIVPAHFYMLLARDTFVRGMGWFSVWAPVLTLGLLASFFFFIAWQKVRIM